MGRPNIRLMLTEVVPVLHPPVSFSSKGFISHMDSYNSLPKDFLPLSSFLHTLSAEFSLYRSGIKTLPSLKPITALITRHVLCKQNPQRPHDLGLLPSASAQHSGGLWHSTELY